MSYQKIIFVGNLGRDPEMRYMADGTAVTNLSVAVNRKWTDRASGQPKEETGWFKVSVWGKQAEACNQYLAKGKQVLVEGSLKFGDNGGPPMFTRQDGTVGSSFEVTADTVRFLGGKDDGNGQGGPARPGGGSAGFKPGSAGAAEDDEIPF